MLTHWLHELNRTTHYECSIDSSRRRLSAAEDTAAAALRVVQDMQRAFSSLETVAQRAFSSAADARTRCGSLVVGRNNVTKSQGRCGSIGHSAHLGAQGIPTSAAYLLERLALCRLQRVALSSEPCGGRRSYFPQLLSSDDDSLSLTTSYEGVPLGSPLAPPLSMNGRGADTSTRPTYDELASSARRRGLGSPRVQLACAARQLAAARVVHLDMWCKNVLVRDGAITLIDLDMARIDGRFPPPDVKFKTELSGSLAPPRSDRAADWERILTSCLGANRTSWASDPSGTAPRNDTGQDAPAHV